MKKTLYAGLGLVAWKVGKWYMRQRARNALHLARR
jgi:type IV secretory pathway TrbD component